MKNFVDKIKPFFPSFLKRQLRKPFNPYWYRDAVGGLWDEMGQLQFDFLVDHGLRPEHYFLDVGCGSLRGGLRFIQYLESGHYFGIDINDALIDAGRAELQKSHLHLRKPTLKQTDNFDFQSLNQEFDYALAQSVLHLPINNIIRCIMNIEKVLVSGGKFYVSFFENPQGKFNLEPVTHPRRVVGPNRTTYFDKPPYHCDFETFKWICEGTKLNVEYIGDWNHPSGQKMVVFIKI